jgi:glucose/arabinose dehydrogenase
MFSLQKFVVLIVHFSPLPTGIVFVPNYRRNPLSSKSCIMSLIFTTQKNALAKLLSSAALPFLLNFSTAAQSTPVLIFDTVLNAALSEPVDIVNAHDASNRLFIVEKTGTIKIFSGGTLLPGNFLDIPDSIAGGGERGLLSLAFHPLYSSNRYFFVYYTNTAGNIRITRFQTQAGNPNAADESTGTIILTIPHPSFSNHNGAKLNFGPDGNLYFATGDGGSGGDPGNNAQNGNSLLGKMMRLNVDNFSTPPYYSIPGDNPYLADDAVRDEIFTLGLRNPWRWSFDRLNNDVWIADVGQGAWEEVNRRTFATSGGINYGWRCYEGSAAYNTAGCLPPASYISPIFSYPHNFATGGFSITGGYVYRAAQYPAMYGYYICADYVSGNVWLIKPNGLGWNITQQSGLPGSITGFGEAENGDMYAVALNGNMYKVITSTVLPVSLLQFAAKAFTGYNEIKWKTTNEQNIAGYEIEYSFDGVNFQGAGIMSASNNPGENNYSYQHLITAYSKIFYRLKITDRDGRITYSGIVVLDKKKETVLKITPMPLTSDQCTVNSEKPIEQVTLYSMQGSKIFTKMMNNVSGSINIPLPHLQNGVYMMQFKLNDGFVNEKILVRH